MNNLFSTKFPQISQNNVIIKNSDLFSTHNLNAPEMSQILNSCLSADQNFTHNFTQASENNKSFSFIRMNSNRDHQTVSQTSIRNINTADYTQIPLNYLLTQYHNSQEFHPQKQNFKLNLNSISQQSPVIEEKIFNSFNENEVNEIIKIQDKMRKFLHLFKGKFEDKFNSSFPSLKSPNMLNSLNDNNKSKFNEKMETKIYIELKNKLIETEQNTNIIFSEQNEKYLKLINLVLRIKEKSLQAKKCSDLIEEKLDNCFLLNESLVLILEKLDKIFRFENKTPYCDIKNEEISYIREQYKSDFQILLKSEFDVILEIIKNLKFSINLKKGMADSNDKLNEKFSNFIKEFEENIKNLNVDFYFKEIDSVSDNKSFYLEKKVNDGNKKFENNLKTEEATLLNIKYEEIKEIMDELSQKVNHLSKNECEKNENKFDVDYTTDKLNYSIVIDEKQDQYNRVKQKNESFKNCFNNDKDFKKSYKNRECNIDKILYRKPNMIRKEISDFFQLRNNNSKMENQSYENSLFAFTDEKFKKNTRRYKLIQK